MRRRRIIKSRFSFAGKGYEYGVKITTKGRYAIHILYDLAVNAAEHPVSVKEIATENRIFLVKYTEQIMAILNKAGYVSSTRGFQGGYRLTKPFGEYVIGDVLRLTEGRLFAGRVSIYRARQLSQAGTAARQLFFGKRWIRRSRDVVDNVTLADLVAWQQP